MASIIYRNDSGKNVRTSGSVYFGIISSDVIVKIPAAIDYTINAIKGLAVDSGSCTVSIQVNGVPIDGLDLISVGTAPQDISATTPAMIEDGGLLIWAITNVNNVVGFRGSLNVSI